MSTNIPVKQRLLEKIRQLPSEKVIEVEDFIDFLYQRQIDSDHSLFFVASKLSEASFSKIWDSPEDAEYDNLIVLERQVIKINE